MRNLVLALGLLLAAGLMVSSGVAHGQQHAETIRVYQSPT